MLTYKDIEKLSLIAKLNIKIINKKIINDFKINIKLFNKLNIKKFTIKHNKIKNDYVNIINFENIPNLYQTKLNKHRKSFYFKIPKIYIKKNAQKDNKTTI